MAVVGSELLSQTLHLDRVEMIYGGRNTDAAELCDQRNTVFDRLLAVVVGWEWREATTTTRADDGRAR